MDTAEDLTKLEDWELEDLAYVSEGTPAYTKYVAEVERRAPVDN
jgi:hypothetical protein